MKYRICDTYGAPQCGVEQIDFDTFDELEEYVEASDGLSARIRDGYARVFEI